MPTCAPPSQITGDNPEGKRELDNFIDPEKVYPVIATTSKLLSTGVDAQTCKLIVLDQNIKSMTLFKQIIGRVYSTVPFPVPGTGEEAIQNHILRHVGGSYEREGNWLVVLFNGEVSKGGRAERVVTAASFDPPRGGNLAGAFIGRYTAPATFEGTTLLVPSSDTRSLTRKFSGQKYWLTTSMRTTGSLQ